MMNIETANRLYELRKKNNLSQEEVADKLGISRQSVSKWERAEASPDTDNLISLAKLYNVSLDELLNAEKSSEFVDENSDGVGEVVIDNPETVLEEVEEENHSTVLGAILSSSTAILVVIAYLLLGFLTTEGFRYYWPLFLAIPVVPSFVTAIEKKNMGAFAYPVFVAMVYCFLGMFLELWHPLWILFITIPVYYIIAGNVDKAVHRNDK